MKDKIKSECEKNLMITAWIFVFVCLLLITSMTNESIDLREKRRHEEMMRDEGP